MQNRTMRTRLVMAGMVATLALTATTPSYAWRGWPWVAGGIVAGATIGALAARPYYYAPGPYYYGPPPGYYAPPPAYVYDEPAYAPPPGRVYAAPAQPNGPVRQCWVATDRDKGAGYWHPC